jgi:hypothetical protein
MEKISWTYRVRNEAVLLRVSEQRNIKHTVKRRKANWIRKHFIEGRIEGEIDVTVREGRRYKHLRGNLKKRRGERGLCGEFALEQIRTCRKVHC